MKILTSCESEHNATTATVRSSVKLMSQSTIYNRNMARRRITATLQDDPRPPAIRVMSGLPVFRAIFPPYVPKVNARLSSPPVSEPTPSDINMLLENGDICTFHSVTSSSRPTRNGRLLPIAASSVVGGILSELYRCKGLTATRASATTISPFSGRLIVLAPAGLQLVGWHQPLPVPTPWRAMPVVLPGAVHMSLLFTMKEVIAGHLELQELSPSYQPVTMTTLVSSTIAGAFVSVVRALQPPQDSFLTASLSPSRGRQVLGATAYFTTYEALKAMLNPLPAHSGETRQQTPWTTIALAGAVAGSVYESILLQSRSVGITSRWSQVVCRAAPTHALMFLGYEATRDVLTTART